MKELKTLLLLGGKDEALISIKQLGLNIILMQYPEMLTDVQVENANKLIVLEMGSEYKALDHVAEILKKTDIHGVLSFYPTWLMTAAEIAKSYFIPGNAFKPVYLSQYKDELRLTLDKKKLNRIRWQRIESVAALYDFYNQVTVPIIVKPVAGGGSAGVRVIEKSSDIPFAYEYAHDVPFWANMDSLESILAEEYIGGDEYSVESISHNGEHEILGIVKKITTGAPHFIEVGHVFPAPLSETQKNEIQQTVLSMLNAIGQREGPCHTEVKFFNNQTYIIETQTRFGGDQIWELIAMVTGCDVAVETAANLMSLGKPQRLPKYNAAAVIHFIPPQGQVLKVSGISQEKSSTNLVRLSVKELKNKTFKNAKHSADRVGYCLCSGNSPEEAFQHCIDIASNIEIHTNNGIKHFIGVE